MEINYHCANLSSICYHNNVFFFPRNTKIMHLIQNMSYVTVDKKYKQMHLIVSNEVSHFLDSTFFFLT